MKNVLLVTSLFAFSAFGASLQGTISDSGCAAKHADASEKSVACVKGCIKKGASPVLVSGDKVYKIANADKVMDHLGHKVTINGDVTGTNRYGVFAINHGTDLTIATGAGSHVTGAFGIYGGNHGTGALAITSFIGGWNSFLGPLTLMSDPSMYTYPVALANLKGVHGTDTGALLLGSAIATLPMLFITVFGSRRIIDGLTAGALTG